MDWGKKVTLNVESDEDFVPNEDFDHYYKEEWIHHDKAPGEIGDVDKNLWNLKDRIYINGTFQRMSYIEPYRDKICSWLTYGDKYKILDYSSQDICVIQLRGGDYTTGHSMLPPQYYHNAMKRMKENNPNIQFVIVTDDPATANRMIPGVPVVGSAIAEEKDHDQKNIGWYVYPGGPVSIDYSILNTAKYAIISASTFAFWPIWTSGQLENVIAPMYWFDWSRSDGWWRMKDGIVSDDRWLWLDREGYLYSSDSCKQFAEEYYA